MSFYKRSTHSFLGQTNTKTMTFHENEIIGSLEAKGLLGIGIAEETNGLKLCTEYLGFESYDMKMSENEVENKMTCLAEEETERVERKRRKTTEEINVVAPAREGKREFPPPLSSLNGRGQRSFYLRPVRKDGRLELTQVMIDRPEIFHASRENGRLRLHLVDGRTTREDPICDGNLPSVDNRLKAHCDSEEVVDLKDERKHYAAASDELVDVSMINDDSGAGSLRYRSNKEISTDEHDTRTWRYKNCYKCRNHDEDHYHYHHHHHYCHHHHHRHYHIHPYLFYNSNKNMHLWSRLYVKTWS